MFRIFRYIRFMRISATGLGFIKTGLLISMSNRLRMPCLWGQYALAWLDWLFQEKDNKDWLNNVKMEIIQAIRERIVPDTFLLDVHSVINNLIGSSSRGHSRRSLTSGYSGSSLHSNMRRLRSRHTFSQSIIGIHRNSSSRGPKGISGIQRCCPRWHQKCRQS